MADDGPATAQDMAEMVRKTMFRTTRLRPGYEEEEVDTFLDEIVATLADGGRLDPALVRAASFRTTCARPGYALQDVDDLLARVARFAEAAAG